MGGDSRISGVGFSSLDFTVVKPSIKQHCNRGIRVTFQDSQVT